MDQMNRLPEWARWATRGITPITYRRDGTPIWPMRGGADEPMPADEDAMRRHLATAPPGGHGDEPAADMTLAGMTERHTTLHAAGAEHGHANEAPPANRSDQAIRDGSFLVRTLPPTFTYEDGESVRAADLRAEGGDDGSPGYLTGRFAVFDTWTEVRSRIEGHFMERTGEGAFRKAIAEGRPPIIFQHGWDPQLGTRPIAPTEELGTDTRGGHYGGPLLKGVPELIVSGLRAGLYGSSYRFRAIKPEVNVRPKPSHYNPEGIPEVTIREATLKELGPGMFPVYKDTTAIVRSETDEFLLSRFGDPEQILSLMAAQRGDLALPTGAGDSHSTEGSRTDPPPAPPVTTPPSVPSRFRSRDEWLDWLKAR